MRLSDNRCKTVKSTKRIQKLFDGGGLYLEVKPSGGKHWKLKYRYGNKEKKLAIGTYPLISLKEARELREEAKKLLVQNKDPSFEKQEAKRQILLDDAFTFEVLAREWHEEMKYKWVEHNAKSILKRMEAHLFPLIGDMPVKTITPPLLLSALKEIEKKGVYETTKRMKQYAGQVFRYGVATGKAEKDVSADIGGFLKTAKVKHHAALAIEELPEFLEKLNKNEARLYNQTRWAIELMMLTFVRTSELLEAVWTEFDLENKTWLIPAERMKMRKPHIVPLAAQTISILEKLKPLYNGKSSFILPSPISPKKTMSENTILYALYRLGYRGKATGHGFRALAMTAIKEKLGYRHEVVDRQLAHAHRNSIDAAYDRAQFLDERVKMMQEWADYVCGFKRNY
jgi:integrase